MGALSAAAADGAAGGVCAVAVVRAADDVRAVAVVWVVAFHSVVVLQGAVILVVVVWIAFAGLVLVVSVVGLQEEEVLVVGNLVVEVLVVVVFAAGVSVVVLSVEELIATVSCAPSGCQRQTAVSAALCTQWLSASLHLKDVCLLVICLSHSMQLHIGPEFTSTSPDRHISPASHTRGSVSRPAEKTA